ARTAGAAAGGASRSAAVLPIELIVLRPPHSLFDVNQLRHHQATSRLGTVWRANCRRGPTPRTPAADSAQARQARESPHRMSSFVSRGAVLASARLLNQALALLSPLLLVR